MHNNLVFIGSFLVFDTLVIATRSNFNLGVVLPAVIGLPLLLLGIFYARTKEGTGRVIRRVMTVLYALGCTVLLVCGTAMFRAAHEKADKPADALVVLGAALHGDKVTWVLSNRLDTAAEYLLENPETICVTSGGQGPGESLPEGEAMKQYLIGKGVEEERIIAETKATSTKENFLFSRELAEERLGDGVSFAFVTNDFHVYRAGKTAASLGISAAGVAAPDVWYLRPNNFLRECAGIVYYTLKGSF